MDKNFKVPIRNIFCMLSYVANMPDFIKTLNKIEDDLITYELIVKMFNNEVATILQQGLIRDYQDHIEETGFISGRLLINESIPLIAARKPVLTCEKDDYSADMIFNQIIKSTLSNIYKTKHISQSRRHRSFMYWEEMNAVDEVFLTREIFQKLTFNRHNIHYKRVLHIARLLYELELLSHQTGEWSLNTVDMSESELNRLFEDFLFHFYRINKHEYQIKSERMQWNLQGNKNLLPTMLTDVSLTHRFENKKIIIDAKFYKNIFQTYYDKDSFHSHNLYQLFTYLMHQSNEFKQLRGILIYPFNGEKIHEIYKWDDRMTMEITTVNLENKWHEIEAELMNIV